MKKQLAKAPAPLGPVAQDLRDRLARFDPQGKIVVGDGHKLTGPFRIEACWLDNRVMVRVREQAGDRNIYFYPAAGTDETQINGLIVDVSLTAVIAR